jgi:hypothetical protein
MLGLELKKIPSTFTRRDDVGVFYQNLNILRTIGRANTWQPSQ